MGNVELNTHLPHPARVYDCLLGGKDNFKADRDLAAAMIRDSPGLAISARANRAFMTRAARHLAAERGIGQFLDIGTGLPTSPNLHEVVQSVAPESRVVYVDNDPIVLVHARALLTSTPQGRTAYVDADLHDPDAILAAPQVADTLDLSTPLAVFLIAVMHFVKDDQEARRIIDRLVRPLAPGSALVLSILTANSAPEQITQVAARANAGGIPVRVRDRREAEALFAGVDLVDPGVALVNRWRPDEAAERVEDAQVHVYGGLAIKS